MVMLQTPERNITHVAKHWIAEAVRMNDCRERDPTALELADAIRAPTMTLVFDENNTPADMNPASI